MVITGSQGKDLGSKFIDRLENFARNIGKSEITLEADISIGKYAWARMGFDANRQELEYSKDGLKGFGSNLIEEKSKIWEKDDVSKAEKNEFDRQLIDYCKAVDSVGSMKEIAEFKHGDLFGTKKDFGIDNSDVPNGLKMNVGKAFLLDKVVGWNGNKEVK